MPHHEPDDPRSKSTKLAQQTRLSDNRRRSSGHCISPIDIPSCLLRALPADMTRLTTPVASLASSTVERPTVRRGALAGDMSQLPTSVALHGLRLAIAGEVVGPTALVASRGAVDTAGETAAETTAVATSGAGSAAAHAWAWGGAGALRLMSGLDVNVLVELKGTHGNMPDLAAGVAASAGGTAAQAESRAVSLDMTEALAVVALLGL